MSLCCEYQPFWPDSDPWNTPKCLNCYIRQSNSTETNIDHTCDSDGLIAAFKVNNHVMSYFNDSRHKALLWLSQIKLAVEQAETELMNYKIGDKLDSLDTVVLVARPAWVKYRNYQRLRSRFGGYLPFMILLGTVLNNDEFRWLATYKTTEFLDYSRRMIRVIEKLDQVPTTGVMGSYKRACLGLIKDSFDDLVYYMELDTAEERLENTQWGEFLEKLLKPKIEEEGTGSITEVFEIPGFLEKRHSVTALGDYCAKYNFMSEKHANQLGLPIKCGSKSITIGSGETVSTAGTVHTQFRFEKESKYHEVIFHLLPDCIHDVILGKPFLKLTRTFSNMVNFCRRVKKRLSHDINSMNAFLYLGDSAPRFSGLVNGAPQEALADSGSKVLLMDEDFARRMNIPIMRDKKNRRTLVFANGSTAETSGIAYRVKWQYGDKSDNKHHFLDFHIMKNAPAPVILNDSFLFKSEGYSKYEQYLIDDDLPDDDHDNDETVNQQLLDNEKHIIITSILLAINIIINRKIKHTQDCTSISTQIDLEVIRRGLRRDEISDLADDDQRVAAQLEEDQRIAEFDRRIALLRANHGFGSLPPSTMSPSATTPAAITPSVTAPSTTPSPPSPPTPTTTPIAQPQKKKWKFGFPFRLRVERKPASLVSCP